MFTYLKVGDSVTRMLAGVVPMKLTVSNVTNKLITCQPFGYTFDINNGAEIDVELDWNKHQSGSYLIK